MQKHASPSRLRLFGLVIGLGLIGLAGVITYNSPFTVTTMGRGGDGQVDVQLRRYMLFFVPIGEEHFEDVQEVELHHNARSDASLVLRNGEESIRLRTTFFFKERAIQTFLADESQSTYSFRTFPHLFFVAPFVGLGTIFLCILVVGEFLRIIRFLKSGLQ